MVTPREAQLLRDASTAGITSSSELANFMAQVSHESQGLTRLNEGFIYSHGTSQITVNVPSALRQGHDALESARVDALHGRPQALAELMYGGRMGNATEGDGYKYHGRGYIQLTGMNQYRAAGAALDLDLVANPDLAALPENAGRIATWYWSENVHGVAREDVRGACYAVNGGYTGLSERQGQFDRWKAELTPEVMEGLARGEVLLPITEAATVTGSLRQSSHGDAVRDLQAQLNRLGRTEAGHGPLTEDGNFGPGTRAAVEAFQAAHGLHADGVVGPGTRSALDAADRAHLAGVGESTPSLRLSDPGHRGYPLYVQAYAAAARLDESQGRTPDSSSQNLAASLTCAAQQSGFHSIDHVVLNDEASRAWAVQGNLNSPFKQFTDVNVMQAVQTPVQASTQSFDQIAAQSVQAAQPAQNTMQQVQAAPAHDGPAMHR